ncbi:MAG: hypothetical protein PUE47_05795 [Lachnospiraceae bacterium]|nr:hypothetical protein [Lachnospiraceae bacterium]
MNNEGGRKLAFIDRMLNQGFETLSIEPPVNGRGNSLEFGVILNDISLEDLKNAIHERNIDAMSIAGIYLDKPIVVGVDLRRYYPFITIVKKNAADVKALETALRLTD